jgi:chromosome segregation ATPase
MALAEIDFYVTSELDGIRAPQFDRARNGVNPEQVAQYVARVAGAIGRLRKELGEVRAELELAHQRYDMARDNAYAEVANRMAELVRSANEDADRVRTEAREAAHRTTARARAKAERIQREAERLAEGLRKERERARDRGDPLDSETKQIVEALKDQRDAMLAAIHSLRRGLVESLDQIDSLVSDREKVNNASGREVRVLPEEAPRTSRRATAWEEGEPRGPRRGIGAPF